MGLKTSSRLILLKPYKRSALMELLIELVPTRSFMKVARAVASYVDGFDVPEAPMGIPRPSSVVIGTVLRQALGYGYKVIAHVRLGDVNPVALASLVMGAEIAELDGVLITVGDRPAYGTFVNQMYTDRAVEFLRNDVGVRISLGAILSLRYDFNAIGSRVRKLFDFFHVIRVSRNSIDALSRVSEMVAALGKKLYTYIIVATPRNREFIESELRQPFIEISELRDFVDYIRDLVSGVIVSCPLDKEGRIEAVKLLHRIA